MTDEAKRRRQELWSAARLCTSRALLMRAPVSRPRPLLFVGAGLLVGDHALVGEPGLEGEFWLGFP